MNNNAYSRSIPQWKGTDSLDTAPQPLAVVEWEGGYLLPQSLAASEIQVGCAVRTRAITVNTGAHGAPYPQLPLTSIAI